MTRSAVRRVLWGTIAGLPRVAQSETTVEKVKGGPAVRAHVPQYPDEYERAHVHVSRSALTDHVPQ